MKILTSGVRLSMWVYVIYVHMMGSRVRLSMWVVLKRKRKKMEALVFQNLRFFFFKIKNLMRSHYILQWAASQVTW